MLAKRYRIEGALPKDAAEFVTLRGRTRENAVPAERLAELGITAARWGEQVRQGDLIGHVAWVDADAAPPQMAGYAFGDVRSGEVVVLALLPEHEGQGLGRALLERLVHDLLARGHGRLFLGCAADPRVRSHGFYRHLGWRATGEVDGLGDEVLEWLAPPHAAVQAIWP